MRFKLPETVRCVAEARRTLCKQYSSAGLTFTPDGKFVGDLGEAIAAELFGIRLEPGKHIDGYSACGKPVQIKTTGRPRGGGLFRPSDFSDADKVHLIVFFIDWNLCEAEVIYNGPERLVRDKIKSATAQREVGRSTLIKLDAGVEDMDRLKPIDGAGC